MHMIGYRIGVLAAEHREAAGRFGEQLQRVGVEHADRLLHARDVRMRGELEQRSRTEPTPGAVRDVVERRSAPCSRRRRPACARRCRLPTGARSTARRRARRRRHRQPRPRSSPRWSYACCSCRCRRSAVRAPRAHARAHASMTARFSASSSALASPVVPSATMPAAPAARYSRHKRSIAARSTPPETSNGVISGTQTPRRSRSLVIRKAYRAVL